MVIGCNDYDLRLEKTLEEKKYEKRLNTNLEAAPAKSKLQADDIFIRPPLGLTGPRDAFSLIAVEPGRFDIENSFLDEKKGTSLHVLPRVKKPKPTSPKKGPGTGAAAPEPAARGKFLDDVVEVVKAAYSIELAPGDLKPEQHKHLQRANEYKGKKLGARQQTDRGVRLYRAQRRPPRSRDDLRVSHHRKKLHGPEDRSMPGKSRCGRAGQTILRKEDPGWTWTAVAKWSRRVAHPPI